MAEKRVGKMMNTIKESFNSDHAKQYDRKAVKAKWLDPAILFGLAYRFVKPNETLLDIGIGTGLSSELFHKAGLRIHGIDFSPDMLSVCQAKNLAVDLREHDLSLTPYPYPDHSIHHAICTGVTHLFKDLGPIFQELGRILKFMGTFSFVVADCDDTDKREKIIRNCRHPEKNEVTVHRHSRSDVQEFLKLSGFGSVYGIRFTASSIGGQTAPYRAYVVQKTDSL